MIRRVRQQVRWSVLAILAVLLVGSSGTLLANPAEDGAWSQLQPSGALPHGRYYHDAIYDPVRDRMIVFGGWNGSQNVNDVWELSLGTAPAWTQMAPQGGPPAGRAGHVTVYDPVGDRMIVFGGASGSTFFHDCWELSLAGAPAWTELHPAGDPPAGRASAGAVYVPELRAIVLFGGTDGVSPRNDVWLLSLDGDPTWTELHPQNDPPAPRVGFTAVYDAPMRRMIVFAGTGGAGPMNDTWALDLSAEPYAWVSLDPGQPLPPATYEHTAIYEPALHRMIVFGPDPVYSHETWSLALGDTPQWTHLNPAGTWPPPLSGESSIYDRVRHRMLVFAGNPNLHNETWALTWPLPMVPAPQILSVRDVGNDQGRHVRLVWQRSQHDAAGSDITITEYGIYRKQDQWLRRGWLAPMHDRLQGWDFLTRVPARGDSLYQCVVETLCDSTIAAGICWSEFMVSAMTADPFVYFDSEPSGGYSVDNLAPGAPPNPRWEYPAIVRWDEVADADFDYFNVYGSEDGELDNGDELIAQTAGTAVDLNGMPRIYPYYFVTATDFAGNEGIPAVVVHTPGDVSEQSGLSSGPALIGASPSPFTARTSIRFSLARGGHARVDIHDAGGRLVRTLHEGATEAGAHAVAWDGATASGEALPSGVYFVRLTTAGFAESRPLTLVR